MELNINRLVQVIRWNLISEKKKIMRGTIGVFLGVLGATLIGTGFLWSWAPVNIYAVRGVSELLSVIISITMFVFAASILRPIKTKSGFIYNSMLPATKLEKFIANWFRVTVITILMIIVGVVAGDLVQMLLIYLVTGEAHSYSLALIDIFFNFKGMPLNYIWGCFLAAVFVHSTFILGGCFFRKVPVIFTFLAWVIIPVTLSFILVAVIRVLESMGYDPMSVLRGNWNLTILASKIIGSVVFIALTTFNYWMSFRIYKRIQVINNKFFN